MTKQVFGLTFSVAGEAELTETIVRAQVPSGEGPRVVATANLDHVVNLSVNDDLKRAYSHAWAITADGTPVYLYAKLRGLLLPGRVTGSDLCWRILDAVRPAAHRLFFVVSSERTAERIRAEMTARGFPPAAIRVRVPPFGFESDGAYSADFAHEIGRHRTTHLFFGVGSPKSEIWTDRYRVVIGDCYVLNFGAGLDFFAGTRARAPKVLRNTGLEWAWRLALEPRRLFRRYLVSSWRFLWIVGADMAAGRLDAPMTGVASPPGLSRRGVLAGACLVPAAFAPAWAAGRAWPFFVNVNFTGLEGSDRLPGRAGTDYFVASAADLAYVAARTTGPSRLPFRWERLQPRPGDPLDPVYLSEIKAVADAAAQLGRTIVLDCHNFMHRLVDGSNHAVDGKDGVLTRWHFADLWTRVATAFGDHPGVAGWDLMNEPQGLTEGQDLAGIMQAAVDAIDRVEGRKIIYVEGDGYSSAAEWVAKNPRYPIEDRFDRIVYSAHCYPDQDGSGTHFDYAALAAHGLSDSVLVDRTRGFARWCADRRLRGHIGETNVGTDDPRWLDVLRQGLTFWKAQNLPVTLWMYGANFGANPYNLFPVSGQDAPQWQVVAALLAE